MSRSRSSEIPKKCATSCSTVWAMRLRRWSSSRAEPSIVLRYRVIVSGRTPAYPAPRFVRDAVVQAEEVRLSAGRALLHQDLHVLQTVQDPLGEGVDGLGHELIEAGTGDHGPSLRPSSPRAPGGPPVRVACSHYGRGAPHRPL